MRDRVIVHTLQTQLERGDLSSIERLRQLRHETSIDGGGRNEVELAGGPPLVPLETISKAGVEAQFVVGEISHGTGLGKLTIFVEQQEPDLP